MQQKQAGCMCYGTSLIDRDRKSQAVRKNAVYRTKCCIQYNVEEALVTRFLVGMHPAFPVVVL